MDNVLSIHFKLMTESQSADEEQIEVLIKFCNGASDETVKVKCIGVLECLAQCPDSIPKNEVGTKLFYYRYGLTHCCSSCA